WHTFGHHGAIRAEKTAVALVGIEVERVVRGIDRCQLPLTMDRHKGVVARSVSGIGIAKTPRPKTTPSPVRTWPEQELASAGQNGDIGRRITGQIAHQWGGAEGWESDASLFKRPIAHAQQDRNR